MGSGPPTSCQITFQGLVATEAVKTEVHAWMDRLRSWTIPMNGGQVVIDALQETPARREPRRREQRYRVRMELAMPNQVVNVEYDHPRNAPHEDVVVAIRNAFRAAKGQLEIYALAHPPSAAEASADLQVAANGELVAGPKAAAGTPGVSLGADAVEVAAAPAAAVDHQSIVDSR